MRFVLINIHYFYQQMYIYIYVFIYLYVYVVENYIADARTCFGTTPPSSGNLYIVFAEDIEY